MNFLLAFERYRGSREVKQVILDSAVPESREMESGKGSPYRISSGLSATAW